MLLDMTPSEIDDKYFSAGSHTAIDTHEIWGELSDIKLNEIWNRYIKEAMQKAGFGTGIPEGIERMLENIYTAPKVDWKHILHDFIQNFRGDFTFSSPDRRYSDGFLLPAFMENLDGSKIEKIWFVIDTSGSVTDAAVSEALKEARISVEQIGNMSGDISFFDAEVSELIPFESADDILKMKPIGGGGTSFEAIFEAMPRYFPDELPAVIIIITDGYAPFPKPDATKGVPIVWLIVDSDVTPPFGEVIKIKT